VPSPSAAVGKASHSGLRNLSALRSYSRTDDTAQLYRFARANALPGCLEYACPDTTRHRSRSMWMRILITGGAGFIGSALVRQLIAHTEHEVLNLDKLTYAGNLESLAPVEGHPR